MVPTTDTAPPTQPVIRLGVEAWRAFRGCSGVGAAFIPLGLAFGVLVSHSSLPWWWATVFASVIYAGSLEFLLLGMVLAVMPLASVAVTAFLVNFRHIFYALAFPLHRVTGLPAKAYSTFALSDEAYALAINPAARDWGRARILFVQLFLQLFWVFSVTVGAFGGTLIPDGVVGLEFAMTALFLVLGIEAWKARRDVPTPVAAVGCVIVARLVTPGQMLVVSLGLFTLVLIARHFWMRRSRRPTEPAETHLEDRIHRA
jgi:4-azaleucine resistance transporter AzlC